MRSFRKDAKTELRVLLTLAANDKKNHNKCIHLRDCFEFRRHICIVTDLLGESLFDFLRHNNFIPFPASHIQNFARQLFISVACKSFDFIILESMAMADFLSADNKVNI